MNILIGRNKTNQKPNCSPRIYLKTRSNSTSQNHLRNFKSSISRACKLVYNPPQLPENFFRISRFLNQTSDNKKPRRLTSRVRPWAYLDYKKLRAFYLQAVFGLKTNKLFPSLVEEKINYGRHCG